jgi:hypothetical protein
VAATGEIERVHRVLSAARRAARGDRVALIDVVQAVPELRDPAAHEAVVELETLLPKDPGYAAKFHAQLGRVEDVARLAPTARGLQRSFIADAFERLGEFERADAADPNRKAVYEALAYGDPARIATLIDATLASLGTEYMHLHYAADVLGKSGERVRGMDYARRAEAAWVPQRGVDIAVALAHQSELYADLGAMDDAVRIARDAEQRTGELVLDPPRKKIRTERKRPPDYFSSAIPLLARVHERAGDHAYAARLMRKHTDQLRSYQAHAHEGEIARLAAEMGDVAIARKWLREPFVDRQRSPRDPGEMDSLHAHYVHARLFLDEPAEAIEHAAMIVNPLHRVDPLLAIARWLADREPRELDAALAKLDSAPIDRPMAYEN